MTNPPQNPASAPLDPDAVYALLEEKFLTWKELQAVPVADCGEPLVDLAAAGFATHTYTTDLRASSGDQILVRAGVAERLKQAEVWLQAQFPAFRLQVFYGYRAPSIQQEGFEKIRQMLGLGANLSEEEMEQIHRFIAVPDVAGHPTGGAVDVTVLDGKGQPLDMGTPPHAFVKDSYTFSPFISRVAWKNRQILRAAMVSAGFAPYDGEWWHFSFGDREWARYWGKPEAIYGPVAESLS